MDAGVWSMTPSRNGVKSSRWMTLNEAIRCWERGFELEHGTPPNRKDVQNRPSIGACFRVALSTILSLPQHSLGATFRLSSDLVV